MQKQLSRGKFLAKDTQFTKTQPLLDIPQKFILLDTCYLISIATSGYPLEESLKRLKGENSKLIVTPQVIAELENIASGRRRENGRPVLTSREMCDLRKWR